MAAPINGQEQGQVSSQAKLDLLIIGDVTTQHLADTVRKFFSSLAEVTVTVGGLAEATALLEERPFHMVFLTMTSLVAEGRGMAQSLRFGKKNAHFLFVFILPENFKGGGADIALAEPLTAEKLGLVAKYWEAYFSSAAKSEIPAMPGSPLQESCLQHLGRFPADLFACSNSLKNDLGLEAKVPLSDFERSKKISLLHSSKEKLRRERIRLCCEQLRTLVPHAKGRKTDAASVLEATVEHVRQVRDRIPPAIMGQITEVLQNNQRFCKKQAPLQLLFPRTVVAPRETSVSTSTCSPVRGISLLANRCLNVSLVPAAGGPVDGAERGQSGSAPEQPVGDVPQGWVPSPALSLGSIHAVRCCPAGIPPWDTATTAHRSVSGHSPSSGPTASKPLPPPGGSGLGQARAAAAPDCPQQFWVYQ